MKETYYLVRHENLGILKRCETYEGARVAARKGQIVTEHYEASGAFTGSAWERSPRGVLIPITEDTKPGSRAAGGGE